MPRKLPFYLSDLQALTAAAILPRALRRADARHKRTGQPALLPSDVTLLAGLAVLCKANRGGIRARELRATKLISATSYDGALVRLVGAGYITRSRRIQAELVLYTVTSKGADALALVANEVQREARQLWHVLTSEVVRSKPTRRRRCRPARRRPDTPSPAEPEPTPTPSPDAAQ